MIKELIIILVILALVISLGIYEQNYINSNTNGLISSLNEVKNQVKEQKEATQKIKDVNKRWNEIEGSLSVFIDHEHIDNVGESISILQTALEENEKEDIIKEIDKTIFLLNDIQDINKLKLKNIF